MSWDKDKRRKRLKNKRRDRFKDNKPQKSWSHHDDEDWVDFVKYQDTTLEENHYDETRL